MIKVAINGFGRIGRCALRQICKSDDVEVVAINNRNTDSKTMAYLFKYDSVHRTYDEKVGFEDNCIIINNKKIKTFAESEPENLPWKDLDVDVVLECTGAFTSVEKSMSHINAGAKRVIISAPAKDDAKTIVHGVNDNELNDNDIIISAASCTTNCLAPVLKVLVDNFEIESGFMSTVHALTNDQSLMDEKHSKGIESRRGRSAFQNIIPTSTGAASAIGKVIPSLQGKLNGIALRVPVSDGSLVDLTVVISKKLSIEEITNLFRNNQNDTIKIAGMPIVSSDIIGTSAGAVIDSSLINVEIFNDKSLLKIIAWYDNEWGYTAQMIRTMRDMFKSH